MKTIHNWKHKRSLRLGCEILISANWNEYLKECHGTLNLFFIVNLMLGRFLFKKFKRFIQSCSLPKAVRMSSTYLLLRSHSFSYLDLQNPMKIYRNQRTTQGYSLKLVKKLNAKKKMSPWCRKKEKFLKFFFSDV